jgi:hypothetical protein
MTCSFAAPTHPDREVCTRSFLVSIGGEGRQVPIAHLLRRTNVVDLTYPVAKRLGDGMDPVDAHVAFLARDRGWPVLISDPDDLLAIDPGLRATRLALPSRMGVVRASLARKHDAVAAAAPRHGAGVTPSPVA